MARLKTNIYMPRNKIGVRHIIRIQRNLSDKNSHLKVINQQAKQALFPQHNHEIKDIK